MTVNTTNILSGPYLGDDIADTFDYDFRIEDKTQIAVYQTIDDGTESILVVDTDYTVNTVGDDAGGTITRVAGALPTGYTWLFRADYKQTQLTAFASQGGFFPDVHEAAMDKLTFLIQQYQEELGRSIKSDVTSGVSDLTLPSPVARNFLRWRDDLTGLENISVLSQGVIAWTDLINCFDSISGLRNFTDQTEIGLCYLKGRTSISDGAEGHFTWDDSDLTTEVAADSESGIYIAPSSDLTGASGAWVRQHPGAVNVKWFGAVGDGVTDDTTAIQAAIDSGLSVYFPPSAGTYLITDSIDVTTNGQGLFGDPGNTGGRVTVSGGKSAVIELSSVSAIPMFDVDAYQVVFKNIELRGDLANTTDVGIHFRLSTNTDDMDGYVIDCAFLYLLSPVYFYGRGLRADGNLFSSTAGGDSITLDWDAAGETGPEIETDPLYKGRAHIVTNNRFHNGGGYCVKVKNHITRGLIVANNNSDIGAGILYVDDSAGVRTLSLTGNTADLCTNTPVYFGIDSIVRYISIVGNTLGGAIAGDVEFTIGYEDKRPTNCIAFIGCAEINGVTITGNSFVATDKYAIDFLLSTGSAITPENINISDNLFSNIGLDGTASLTIIKSSYDISNFKVRDNIFSDIGGTVVAIISSAAKTFTGVSIKGNLWPTATSLILSTTLADPIDVDYKQGGYGTDLNGVFIVGSLGAYSSTTPFHLRRFGSTGGVTQRFYNDSGYVGITGHASGSNAGAITPSADNTTSSGSASLRWSVVYAATGTINTSDERVKTFFDIEESEKLAALEIKKNLRKFKFNEAIKRKGDGARIHFGVSAQKIGDIIRSFGLDPYQYGFFCYDEWDKIPEEKDDEGNIIQQYVPSGNMYGIRYEELLAFILSAI